MEELSAKDFIVRTTQVPGQVTFYNFEELKQYLRNGLSIYEMVEYTTENMETAIENRKQLKAIKKKLVDKKKEIEKAYSMPYEEVRQKLDELIEMVKEPLNRADEVIKQCERAEKRARIIAYVKQEVCILGEYATNVIKCPAFYNSKWLNVSYQMSKIKEEISTKVKTIEKDLAFIKENGGDNVPVILARYFETLSMVGMEDFLQVMESETVKASTGVLTCSMQEENSTDALSDTDTFCQEREGEIVEKVVYLYGTEKQIDKALQQIKMSGVVVEFWERDNCNSGQRKAVAALDCGVSVGSTVKIYDVKTGRIEIYKIQDPESDIGKLVVGKNVGDEFIWNDGRGSIVRYKILELCN